MDERNTISNCQNEANCNLVEDLSNHQIDGYNQPENGHLPRITYPKTIIPASRRIVCVGERDD